MAINYGDYAKSYAGGINMQPITKGVQDIQAGMEKKKIGEYNTLLDDHFTSAMQPLWNATLSDIGDDTGGLMKGFENFEDSGVSYRKFKERLDNHPRSSFFKSRGFNDPLKFKQQYDSYMSSYVPMIEQKLLKYKDNNNVSDTNFKLRLAKNPKLRDFLVANSKNPRIKPLLEHYKTLSQEWGDFRENVWDFAKGRLRPTITGAPLTAITAGLSYWQKENIAKGAKYLAGTKPGAIGLAAGLMDLTRRGVGFGTGTLADAAGASDTTKRISQEVGEMAGSTIFTILAKKGIPWGLKNVAKKGGLGLVARTLAKLGTGAIGGVLSGGLVTAAMAAWTLKDIYDIVKILEEAAAEEQS